MRVIKLSFALIGLSLFGSEAFLGDFGLAINDKSGKPIVETDPDQVHHVKDKLEGFGHITRRYLPKGTITLNWNNSKMAGVISELLSCYENLGYL